MDRSTVSDPQSTTRSFYRLKVTRGIQDTLRFDRVLLSSEVCLLQFNTYTGYTYTIERLDSISPTNTWIAFTNLIPAVSGPVTVSDPQTAANRFYRLKVTSN